VNAQKGWPSLVCPAPGAGTSSIAKTPLLTTKRLLENALDSEMDAPLVFGLKLVHMQSTCHETRCVGDAGTHPLRLLVGEDARRPSCCEVAVDFEGVPGAALVGIDPVFTWISDSEANS
jgi:hypothetical protein